MLDKAFRALFPSKQPIAITAKYGIPQKINLQVRLTPDGWFVVTSPDLPGLITQGRNGKELLDMLNDAILTYFNVPRVEGDVVMDTVNIDGYGTVSYQKQTGLLTA